jgi:MFS family permease
MSAVFGVAAIAGPFVGGALADKSTWRWCFGINLPLGAFTIGVCIWFVQTPAEPNVHPLTFKQKVHQLDIPGMVVAIAGVICLLLGLQWGGGTYPWDNGRVIALLTVSGILLAAFVAMQTSSRVSKLKTIPESITKSYNIWLAASYAMGITSGIYVVMVYLPIWFQVIRGRSALSSGILLTPTIAGYVVASVLAGAATSAIGYYNPPMLLGTALIIPGAALLTTLTPGTSTARIIGFEILYGLGAGFGFGQPMYIVQTLLPEADVPIGVTFITLVQNLTASIFVAMGQSIFQNTLRKRLIHIVPPELMQELLRGGAAAVHDFVPETQRSDALMAYSDALIRTLYITLGMGCATIVGAVAIRWTSMKSSKPEEGNPPNPPLEQTTQEREKLHNAP